jgi:hypothetical protein
MLTAGLRPNRQHLVPTQVPCSHGLSSELDATRAEALRRLTPKGDDNPRQPLSARSPGSPPRERVTDDYAGRRAYTDRAPGPHSQRLPLMMQQSMVQSHTQTTGAGGGLNKWEPQQGTWAVRAAYTHANPTQLQARGGAGAPSANHPLYKPVRSRDRVKEVFMPEVTLVRLVSLSDWWGVV